jgi:hypothetical protein
VLYTTPVVNTPREIEKDITKLRHLLLDLLQEPIRREETRTLKQIQKRDADHESGFFRDYDWLTEKLPALGRLLTQTERILEINGLARVTATVIDAARESLVIG